jgi:hypothetical protein
MYQFFDFEQVQSLCGTQRTGLSAIVSNLGNVYGGSGLQILFS